jgi:hypothetical protein
MASATTIQFASNKSTEITPGHFRMQLDPGLKIPSLAEPSCQLQSFSFTNSIANVDHTLYNNNAVHVSFTAGTSGISQDLDLNVKDGLFNLTMLEVELAKLVTATDTTTKDLYYEMNAAAMFPTGKSLKVKAKARIDASSTNFIVTNSKGPAIMAGYSISATAGGIPVNTTVTVATVIADGEQTITISTPTTAEISIGAEIETTSGNAGFGAAGMARPEISVDGGSGLDAWSNAFTFDELQAVIAADLAGRKTDNILEKQSLRSVKPFTFKHDTISNKLMVIVLGAVNILDTSTLFTDLLGFDKSLWPAPYPADKHSPHGRLGIWTATHAPRLDMTRSLTFHCPTMIESTYSADGKFSGSQVASIPITVSANMTEVWNASFANAVPCKNQGSTISQVDYYITDQEGREVNMQKSSFQGSLLVEWSKPEIPALGTAGASGRMMDVRQLYG